jgi:peroxiredoxin-like protein
MAKPARRYKTFEYTTNTTWKQNRIGTIGSNGKPALEVASPPEFKGVPGVWTPEDMFVAAIETCHMTTFLAFASRANIGLKSYESNAKGILDFDDGGYRFTKVLLTPHVVVDARTDIDEVLDTMHNAHKSCLVGRSVTTNIEVQPTVTVVH